ncbi:DUF6879 family protein [Kitasatospora sp. MAP5-34]|uniref:DUF6879 family protein n=1 Tax=Kitasatospora sp. MAP5-34 TaxID=3035102 RepID=UPI0024760D03|nr:DUF6879 family protein [Kitasatospora sp. MAP5-34]MDH6579220.1 hypothetical protein [Kitasatospora sp. MAP5-34]
MAIPRIGPALGLTTSSWSGENFVVVPRDPHFDQADSYLGAELVEDEAAVVNACQIRDAAWHYAVSREEFAKAVLSTT